MMETAENNLISSALTIRKQRKRYMMGGSVFEE